jgi:hypothetical protein
MSPPNTRIGLAHRLGSSIAADALSLGGEMRWPTLVAEAPG